MDKVLLVSVIALAVALLSMLVNLALVWKISDLKNRLEWVDLTVNDRTSQLHKDDVEISNQLNKLECDTKDAFEIITNNLKLHGTLLDEMSTKFALLDGRVSEHNKQLEDLGNFAGITTGELRVLEQKIYNSCKPQELPEPEPIAKQIEEAIGRVKARIKDSELLDIIQRLSTLEKNLEFNIKRGNEMDESIALCHEHTNANNFKLNRLGERVSVLEINTGRYSTDQEVSIRKHKPDRRRKDNYYRKPNKSNVIIDEFASDIIE